MSIKDGLCTIQINKGRMIAEIDDYLQSKVAITENVDIQYIQEKIWSAKGGTER